MLWDDKGRGAAPGTARPSRGGRLGSGALTVPLRQERFYISETAGRSRSVMGHRCQAHAEPPGGCAESGRSRAWPRPRGAPQSRPGLSLVSLVHHSYAGSCEAADAPEVPPGHRPFKSPSDSSSARVVP